MARPLAAALANASTSATPPPDPGGFEDLNPSPLLPRDDESTDGAARTRLPHLLPRFALAKTVSTGAAQMRSAVARLIRSSSSASRLR